MCTPHPSSDEDEFRKQLDKLAAKMTHHQAAGRNNYHVKMYNTHTDVLCCSITHWANLW